MNERVVSLTDRGRGLEWLSLFAALLPCALLARQLAARLRARFAEPPRAIARSS